MMAGIRDKSFRYEEIALRPRSGSTPRVNRIDRRLDRLSSIIPIRNVGRAEEAIPRKRCWMDAN